MAAELEVLAGLLASPPPGAMAQRAVAEQMVSLLGRIAALPRTGAGPVGVGWAALCEGGSVEVFREGVTITSFAGTAGELLWVDAHVDPETHWHVVLEGVFSGPGSLEAALGSSGGNAAQSTRMTVDVTAPGGLVSSTQLTVDGRSVNCLDADSGIDQAIEHLRSTFHGLAGDGGDGDLAAMGEPAPPTPAPEEVVGGGGELPGGMAGAALGAAAAGLAGAAAAALRKRGGTPSPPAPTPEWYHAAGEQSAGPFTLEELQGLLASGAVSLETLVWSPELADWQPASAVGALRAAAAPAPAVPPPVEPAATWHFAVEGNQQGPVTEADLKAYLAAGNLPPETLVWKPGMAQWAPASSLPELWER